MSMPKTAAISVRVEVEIKAAAEKAAEADGRTLANWVERVLVQELRKQGLLKK
jgi:predicted HicB family RNase H-like nuclease